MASTAPPYTAGSPPPAYNEVVKNIQDAAGKSPTHEKCREIVQGLSDQDRKVLVDTVKNGQAPPIPEDLQKKATKEMMHAIAQPESQHLLESTAQDVANAVKNTREVFTSLKLKFKELDNVAKSDFSTTLETHEEAFSAIIRQSRSLAVNTSSQGQKLDDSIIKTVADKKYTIEQRRKVIQRYITETTKIKGDAERMESGFVKFVRNFGDFVGTFGQWADSQQKTLGRQIEDLNKEISRLQALLAKLEKSMYGMGAAVIVGALAVKFASMTGPAAPFITAIGGIIAGGAALALIGLGIAFAETKAQIEAKQKERDQLVHQEDTIIAARGGLMKLGGEKLDDLKTNINVLASYWQCAQNDAQQIDNWLAEGAEFADMPDYMNDNLNGAANSYGTMAKYLKSYADNLTIV